MKIRFIQYAYCNFVITKKKERKGTKLNRLVFNYSWTLKMCLSTTIILSIYQLNF